MVGKSFQRLTFNVEALILACYRHFAFAAIFGHFRNECDLLPSQMLYLRAPVSYFRFEVTIARIYIELHTPSSWSESTMISKPKYIDVEIPMNWCRRRLIFSSFHKRNEMMPK